jgi:hypothetical protein
MSPFLLISCTILNNQEADPPNPRSQAQPGNEMSRLCLVVDTAARSERPTDGEVVSKI